METNNEEISQTDDEVTIEDPKAVLNALDRAKNDAKKYREEKEKLEAIIEEGKNTVQKYSSTLLKEKVAQEIAKEGIKDPERVLRFIDTNSLSLDDEFNLVGFEDQLSQLKADLPEIFDAKLRVGGQADAAIQASVSTQYSATEMQAMKILGRA